MNRCPHCGKDINEQNTHLQATRTSIESENEKIQKIKKAFSEQLAIEKMKMQESLKFQKQAVSESVRLEVLELKKKIEDNNAIIDKLKSNKDYVSAQFKGEVVELDIENNLKTNFVNDIIIPVKKGVNGCDVLHTVTYDYEAIGKIAIEVKRTKHFSDNWITKLQEDARHIKADVMVIITQAMPKDTQAITQIEGVWIVDYSAYIGLLSALRKSMVDLHIKTKTMALSVNEQANEQYLALVDYMNSGKFKNSIIGIAKNYKLLSDSLAKEKTMMNKIWNEREKQLRGIIEHTTMTFSELVSVADIREINPKAEIHKLIN